MEKVIKDDVFGTLKLDEFGDFYNKDYKIFLFDKVWDIFLSVETYDDEPIPITDMQKKSYLSFLKEQETILSNVEEKLKQYYFDKNNIPKNNEKKDESKIIDAFELIVFTFPWLEDKSVYGFLFESPLEPEHGIAVKICDGEMEVGFQDILT